MNKHFTLNGWKMICCLIFGALIFSTSLTAQSVLTTRNVSNTTQCNNGTDYGLYILIEGQDPYHSLSWANFTEYDDGTATLIGAAVNNSDSGIQFNVNITFAGRTFTAPAGSPKEHSCASPNSDDWYYYSEIGGTLTGVGSCWGTVIDVTSSVGPSFQVGNGANVTNNGTNFGGSGWLIMNVSAQNTWGPQITLNTGGTDGQNADINIDLTGDPLTPPTTTTCDNVTSGGTIGGTQTVCAGDAAATLTDDAAPSGGTGGLEYLWLSSTSSCPTSINQQIAGANAATYNPGTLSQTTYFVRCARRAGCDSWTQGESNCVTVTVDTDPACGNTCDNVSSGGTIGGTQTVCAGDAAATLTDDAAPFGGTGGLEYLWLSSTSSCPTSINQQIAGANAATYNPGTLSQTTYFVRCARRAGCDSWTQGESNCVTVTVDTDPACGNTCDNVTSGGTIGGTQTVCAGDAAATLTDDAAPSGGTGGLEYLWLSSTSSCPTSINQQIAGANAATYNPGTLSQTTYFVRCARRAGCDSWTQGESNCVTVTVDTDPACGNTCDNVTSGGTIGGTQTVCAGDAGATLTDETAPSGGTGGLEYLWLSSTSSCPTSINQQIAGANAATYNPGTLSQTTYFVRCARRAGCDTWTQGESNCVTVTVDTDPACGNTCDNVSSGGTIGGTQTVCAGDAAATLTDDAAPSGGTGGLEYLWLSSTSSCPTSINQQIAGANAATYNPGTLSQTTYFVRCARRAGCDSWTQGESNCVTVTVDTDPACGGGGGGTADDCSDITVAAGNGTIIVTGLDGAPVTSVQIFTSDWSQTLLNCFGDCDSPTQTISVPNGSYLVYVKYYTAGYSLVCEVNETVTVGGGGCTDNDNDGTCAADDCNDSDASVPATPGTTCNDGNANTTGDVIQADGCTCAGTPDTGCTTDWDNDGVCAEDDCDDDNPNVPATPGTTCNDGNSNTTGDVIQADGCTCAGTPDTGCTTDWDNDGVCAEDDCDDDNPNVPAAPGTTCNDGNSNTTGDVIQADGCTCAGTPDTGGNGVDIKLNIIGDGAQVAPYTNFSVQVVVMNEGTSTSNNVVVSIPQPANVVFQGGNASSATQGSYNAYSTFNWTVGTLTPGQSETLTLNYYALAGAPYTVYGQVQSASGTDSDSTPGNGTNPTPNEDDEDVYVTGGGGGGNPSCDLDLTASVSGLTCNDNGTPDNANDDTFTFNVTVSGGNPWGWTGGGQSGDMGQAVSFGPYAISSGNTSFTIADNDNDNCTVDVNVSPPSTCSDGGACTDNDNDGVCAADDCNDNDASVPATPGTSCNDGNANTTGDVIQADGCTCAGTPDTGGGPDCDDITINTGDGTIIVGGLDGAPVTSVQIFTSDWSQTLLNCFGNCDSPMTTVNVPAGDYLVYVKYYTAGYAFVCQAEETVTVSGGGPTGDLSLTCGNNVSVSAAPGANSAVATYSTPNASTTCTAGGLNLQGIAGPASGSAFSVGTTTVTYQATDACGNTETCSFTVTVNGTNANLNINCGNNISVNAAPGANSTTVTYSTPTANTTCNGGVNVTRTAGPASGSAFSVGTTTVTYQATDACGNTETCSFTVTVVGFDSNVTISCPANITVATAPGENTADVFYDNANANTDCAQGGLSVSVTEGPASGAWFSVGTTTVKYTATDACGGMAMCTFTVTVTATPAENMCDLDLLFVVGNTNLSAGDAAIKNRLEAQGYNVMVEDAQWVQTSDANGKDLVLISSTVLSSHVNTKFRNVTVPVITWEAYLFDDMKMTGTSTGTSYGTEWGVRQYTVASSHPINSGLSGTFNIFTSDDDVSWGYPYSAANDVGYIPGSPNKCIIIAYDTDDDMYGNFHAPARRVGFFLRNNNATKLTAKGWQLFDQAIQWLTNCTPSQNFISNDSGAVAQERTEEETSATLAFGIYPNPATTNVTLSLKEANGANVVINVYDQLGRLVERTEVDAAYESAYRINTADFTSGLYLISVQAGDAPAVTKQLLIMPH